MYIPTVVLPVNLEAFWDGWYSIYNGDAAAMTNANGILNGRSIYYELDTLEPDDTFGGARAVTVPLSETHYLFQPGSDDHDFISFSAGTQQYTIRTINLENRPSPSLIVYDAGQSVVASGGTSIIFMPAAAGTYYVEVKPSPTRSSSDGRYGTYTLSIN